MIMSLLPTIVGILAVIGLMVQLVDYLFPWLKNDLRVIGVFIYLSLTIRRCSKRKPIYTMVDTLEEKAKSIPNKNFIYFEDDAWTFQKMNQLSNRVARVMHDREIKMHDTVALMMTTRPEFVGIWFGIGKIGAATALINYNIRGKSLLHCLTVSECRALVISNDDDLVDAVIDIQEDLAKKDIVVYVLGDVSGHPSLIHKALQPLLDEQSHEDTPPAWRYDLTIDSHFCYVHTSGTTGLPKPAVISQLRSHLYLSLPYLSGINESDIIYSPLPLYHAAAGICGILGALTIGCSIVVRRKFSASGFWPDCRRYRATVVQYIGETMRYICDQPPNENDKIHCVRIAVGNGMRPAVWKKFLDRFGHRIKVYEFYAATEANFGTFNLDHHIGSIGTLTPFGKDGDAFYNSGDLLRRDSDYHVYFIDRVGDTFRWKGENVSTNEVADVMSEAPGIKEANVYGVEMPGKEGRAGMMVVLLHDGKTLDCEGVYKHACECLATYARPVFIRIKKEIDLTGTFKHKKVQLMKEGFGLSNVGDDPIFFIDNKNKQYSPLSRETIDQIVGDKIRV